MKFITNIRTLLIKCFTIICIANSCNKNSVVSVNNIHQMMDSVANNISHQGPKEWLSYFEDTPSFYMASDGKLAFPDYNVATKFINDTLVHIITTINLKWSNINVDILNDKTAATRAVFHENIKFKQGNIVSYDGYFTALIDNTSSGYKFRNLHWSIIK